MSAMPISIVTPCHNMAAYVARTVESIVSQDYPRLQYIVVDGASTDGTVDILRGYGNRINTLITEPDEGQYDAVQKGFGLATGEVLAWLNADDVYHPWTLSVVGEVFEKFPDLEWLIGLPSMINAQDQCIRLASGPAAYPQAYIAKGWARGRFGPHLQQESMFWRRRLWERAGGLDLRWKYAADFELWTRFARFAEPVAITVPLAAFRARPGQRSSHEQYQNDIRAICSRLPPPPRVWRCLANRSLAMGCVCRLAMWRDCQVISYSLQRNEWVKLRLRRPLSRSSLGQLILDYALARSRPQPA